MISWKILAAFLAVLVIISVLLSGGLGKNMVSDALSAVGEWLQKSPLSGFLSSPQVRSKEVDITFTRPRFDIALENKVNISGQGIEMSDFRGTVSIDMYASRPLVLKPLDSGFQASVDPEGLSIDSAEVRRLLAEGASFRMKPDIDSDNGSIDISNFAGSMLFTSGQLRMVGNATKVMLRLGPSSWEMTS